MDNLQDKLVVANKALYKIGAKRLASLNDGSPNSIIINDIYETCLTELLEEHPWSFAIQTVTLSTLTLATALPNMNDGMSYAYGLPANFLKVYMLSVDCRYRIEMIKTPYVTTPTLALISDQSTLAGMRYIFLNDDPTTYNSKFLDALSCKLAKACCFKISEASSMAQQMEADYDRALMSAMSNDSNNMSPDQAQADEWFIARLAGSGVATGLPNGNIGFFPAPYSPDF